MIGLSPLAGAVHVTVALASAGVATTFVGAPGTVGAGGAPTRNTSVASSQMVDELLPTVAAGVLPVFTSLSSANTSMSPTPETLARGVHQEPAVSVSPNPESA